MTELTTERAHRVIERCREIAQCTEIAGEITRRFLTLPMHEVHALLRGWMEAAGMNVRVDAIGNLRGVYTGAKSDAPRLLVASHVDTVPGAGAFDGVLGVVLGVALIEELQGALLPFAIEVIGFSEEEGVRFNKPFLGSLALTGELGAALLNSKDSEGISVSEAVVSFGLDLAKLQDALMDKDTFAYLEMHIEQGPTLEADDRSLGIVTTIAGQTRMTLTFTGEANHAGTTPMRLRRDALAAAAHWMVEVEQYARSHPGLVATVGQIAASPGAVNVIPGRVEVSLDVRHAQDAMRHTAVAAILDHAEFAASSRGVMVAATKMMDQTAVPMDKQLIGLLDKAVSKAGFVAGRMTSGAGHDAMIVASQIPSALLFLRSPAGVSHHEDESVLPGDVEAAIATGIEFLHLLAEDTGRVAFEGRKTHA